MPADGPCCGMDCEANRKPKIICGVVIAHVPRNAAGNTWAFLNWAIGLREAGCDPRPLNTPPQILEGS